MPEMPGGKFDPGAPPAKISLQDDWLIRTVKDGKTKQALRIIDTHMADINAVDENGWTPLHWAIGRHNSELFTALIERGADIHKPCKAGMHPVHVAGLVGETDMAVTLIEHGANAYVTDNRGNTAVSLAEGKNFTETAETIKEAASLHQAARAKFIRTHRKPK